MVRMFLYYALCGLVAIVVLTIVVGGVAWGAWLAAGVLAKLPPLIAVTAIVVTACVMVGIGGVITEHTYG